MDGMEIMTAVMDGAEIVTAEMDGVEITTAVSGDNLNPAVFCR